MKNLPIINKKNKASDKRRRGKKVQDKKDPSRGKQTNKKYY
jgi:hypothetical protein